jgi:hypothetical protein
MSLADLARLRWPLLTALALTLAGGYLVWLAEAHHQARRAELARTQETYRRGHDRLRQAEADEAEIRRTIGRFRALEARGAVGPEQRLEWIERLRLARERLGLPALDYELRPRRPLEPGGGAGGYRLTASPMRLTAALLHEEDLLRLLAELRAEPSAILRPLGCRLARGPEAGLAADCELEWVTVEPPRGS